MRSLFFAFIGVLLCGCGSAVITAASLEPDEKEWKALQQVIYVTATNLKIGSTLEISPLHNNDALGTPADSAICVRGSDDGKSKYVVFLINENKVSDFRLAVKLDRCEEQSYLPFKKP
jgi:hypothetical protein